MRVPPFHRPTIVRPTNVGFSDALEQTTGAVIDNLFGKAAFPVPAAITSFNSALTPTTATGATLSANMSL